MKTEFKYISEDSFFMLDDLLFKKEGVSGILEDGTRLVIKPTTIVEDLNELNESEDDCI